jgi:hypothetical protein
MAKKQVVVEDAQEVPKDVLHDYEMWLTGVVHMETHLLDNVGDDVRPGKGKVLESPDQVTVDSWIIKGGPHVRGDLDLSVDRCGAEFAVAHASTLKDVSSVLALLKEEVVWPLLYWDAKEVGEEGQAPSSWTAAGEL